MAGSPRRCQARPRAIRRRGRVAAPVLLVLATTLALGGCSGNDEAAGTPQDQATGQGLTVAGTWPLTGLPAEGAAPRHPVMVVKIDNSASSRPQIGLRQADLVTEELVEGGSTRLAVFYYRRIPPLVGPVRSMRATDIGIVSPAKAVLVASGGAPPTIARVRKAGITTFTEGATGFRRDSARSAPYNLFMRLPALVAKTRARDTVPSYLPFGSAKDLPEGTPARSIGATFSGAHTTSWVYEDGAYVDQGSFAAEGDRFRPDTVLVLRVTVGDAGYKDPAGNPVPETKLTGSGTALLLHGGRAVRGTWSKTLDSTISLRTKDGPLTVPAGRTWIELVPQRGGSVTLTR